MRSLYAVLVAMLIAIPAPVTAQTKTRRSAPAPRPAPALLPPIKEAPEMTCPTPLGVGVNTQEAFCDVMSGRDPAAGILIKIPPHKGPVTLTFDLHNRHTYSAEQTKTNAAYARYTRTYLKKPGTPDEPIFDIFARWIAGAPAGAR